MRSSRILLMAFLSVPFVALAQTRDDPSADARQVDAQMRRIELTLGRINSEQQSLYQQFQMLQEMRRGELERVQESALSFTPPATPPNYDDVVQEREAWEQRIRHYADELDRLYSRYRELDAQKQPLLESLSQLALDRGEQADRP